MAVIRRIKHAYSSDIAPRRSHLATPTVVNDIGEFVAHAAKDPELISSRSQLKEYERKHGVEQCGFDQGDIVKDMKDHYAQIQKKAEGVDSSWY